METQLGKIVGAQADAEITNEEIDKCIESLELGKAPGPDGISNEQLKYGKCDELTSLLRWFISGILNSGYVPAGFNTAVVTPIPKKGVMKTATDFRPISVSSPLAMIFEMVLLTRMPVVRETHSNQFGYKPHTSCKHAFFVVQECSTYYRMRHTPLHVVSLDATKAFDKMWRAGLFYKLIDKCPAHVWRALVNYYKKSSIKVKVDNKMSDEYVTREGCKQGGVLSPFLFNFFIDDLLRELEASDLGASINGQYLGVVAYCDDITLLSSRACDMQAMLEKCQSYADAWKLVFNPKKSSAINGGYSCGVKWRFELAGTTIPHENMMTYLGLPLGDEKDHERYFEQKVGRAERAFYSLNGIGCRPAGLKPYSLGFFFKQFCQSIVTYGMEFLHLSKEALNQFNVRQNTLLRSAIGLESRSHITA